MFKILVAFHSNPEPFYVLRNENHEYWKKSVKYKGTDSLVTKWYIAMDNFASAFPTLAIYSLTDESKYFWGVIVETWNDVDKIDVKY